VHTLKALLETYLAQPPKPIPDLQDEANRLAKIVLDQAIDGHDEVAPPPSQMPRPELKATAKGTSEIQVVATHDRKQT
jgi:hypothetical protein